jgi:Xaa-Pro aminopeptidase
MNFPARLDAVRSRLAAERVDCLLITHLPNVFYLAGFTGSAGVLLVEGQRATLFTDGRYALQAAAEVRGSRVAIVKSGALKAAAARARRCPRIGFETSAGYRTWRQLKEAAGGRVLRPLENAVEQLRLVKDEEEIERIRRSVALNSRAFEETARQLRPGVSELEAAAELEYRMRRQGAERVAFETIVAGGPRSAMPHARAGPRPLRENEFVLLDHGAILGNYASDMTRTVHLGAAGRRARALYGLVLEAQQCAVAAVRAGARCSEVDRAARQRISAAGYARQFPHSSGHGLGIEVHEMPRLARREKTRLPAGAVITIEPGVYIPGFGGVRIEDVVVVRERGPEVLTPTPKTLLELS